MTHSPEDLAIIKTADDALVAKIACVERNYYQDDFLTVFEHGKEGHRYIQPLIKRGTYGRVCCMDKVLASFANTNEANPLQVVILGSGKDTTFFRYLHQQLTSDVHAEPSEVRWFEVDHTSVIEEKSQQVKWKSDVFAASVEAVEGGFRINPEDEQDASNTLVGHDLRKEPEVLFKKLSKLGLGENTPTLFVLECVLMYMPERETESLLSACARLYPKAVVACYEPILGTDPFGGIMEKNLTRAGVTQVDHCLVQTRTIRSHLDKFKRSGFGVGIGSDMHSVYDNVLTDGQRKKASKCDFLDELEEWVLIMSHYCFLVTTHADFEMGRELTLPSTLGFSSAKSEIM